MQNNASATTVFDGLLIFHSSFSYVIQLNPNNLVMTRFQSFMAKSHESSHIFLGQFSTRARPLAKELAGFLSGRQYGDPVASCRGELCELPDERALARAMFMGAPKKYRGDRTGCYWGFPIRILLGFPDVHVLFCQIFRIWIRHSVFFPSKTGLNHKKWWFHARRRGFNQQTWKLSSQHNCG